MWSPHRVVVGTLFGTVVLSLALTTPHAQETIPDARSAKAEEPDRNPLNSWKDNGVTFPVTFTTEVLGNLSGGVTRTVIGESLLRAGVSIDWGKLVGWKGLSSSVSLLYPAGTGLTSAAVRDFNTLSNIDAYDSLRLYEAWLQQEFCDGKFSVRAGQILADTDFFSSESGALFVNSSFGAIPIVSKNLDPPIFPVAAPGVRVRVAPDSIFYAEAALFSGNAGDPGMNNKHNTRFSFHSADGALVFAEIGYRINPKDNAPASPASPEETAGPGDSESSAKTPTLSGILKLGSFYDSGTFSDKAGGESHHGDGCVYAIIDQELWHPGGDADRTLSFFARFGAAPNDRNTVAFYGDTGLNYQGILPARKDDILGLGFSWAQLSSDLVTSSGRNISTHHEAVLELTYQAPLNDHVAVQPDLQCIFNPGAFNRAPDAWVMGMRLNVTF